MRGVMSGFLDVSQVLSEKAAITFRIMFLVGYPGNLVLLKCSHVFRRWLIKNVHTLLASYQ